MSTFRFKNVGELNDTIRRIFFLAYNACSRASGMGIFQSRESVSETDVWSNVCRRGDYPTTESGITTKNGVGDADADYVFGRMMKLTFQFDFKKLTITMPDYRADPEYQGWERLYKTYDALVDAATKELNVGAELVTV